MSDDWTPEHVVDEAQARSLLARARPDLAGARLRPLGEGFDNTCFLAGDDSVLRFPRRAVAVDLLETERRVLATVASRVPLTVPEPVIDGEPGEGFPWPWLGVRLVPGQTACRADPDDVARERAARELAAFLRALWPLHAGAPPDSWARVDTVRRRGQTEDNLEKLRALGRVTDPARFARALDEGVEPWTPREVTCHGDLYARHLVFDEGALTGVIDWGDCHRGDRVKDLAVAFLFFPPGARSIFRDAIGDVDEREWAGARSIALFHATVCTLYGIDTGDDDMVSIGEHALGWVVDDVARISL